MPPNADTVVVQYPRGATALIWVDPTTDTIVTTHPGLRTALRRGVKDWSGRAVFPDGGRIFLSALYDHLFLNGYPVCWMNVLALRKGWNIYRV